jgi:hypothetical protein
VATVIWLWLNSESAYLKAEKSPSSALLRVPPLKGLMFIFVGMNMGVAGLIPHWFRSAPARQIAEQGVSEHSEATVAGASEV